MAITPVSGAYNFPNSFNTDGGRFHSEDGNIYNWGDALVAMANAAISTTTVVSPTITAITRDGSTTYQCATRADIASIPATAAISDTAIVEADWSVWQKNEDEIWEEIII